MEERGGAGAAGAGEAQQGRSAALTFLRPAPLFAIDPAFTCFETNRPLIFQSTTTTTTTPQTQDDLERVRQAGGGRVDITVGSALDIFGGALAYDDVVAWHRRQAAVAAAGGGGAAAAATTR